MTYVRGHTSGCIIQVDNSVLGSAAMEGPCDNRGRLGSSERWLPYSDHHRQFPLCSRHVPYTPSIRCPHPSPLTHTPAHLEHLQQLLLAHLQPHKRLFLFDNASEERVELVKVRGGDLPPFQEHVVVVPVLNWRSVAEAAPVVPLHGLPQDVGTRVPEHLLAWEREGREGSVYRRGGECV